MMKKAESINKAGDLLESWKEISKYLNRDVKTCQRWEIKFALPIHRLDGSPKSRIFAYRHELDKWFKEKFTNSVDHSKQKARKISHSVFILVLACIFMAAAAVIYLVLTYDNPKEIGDFRIEGSKLIFLNSNKKAIVEFDTNFANLQLVVDYKEYADDRHFTHEANYLPLMITKDLNRDGEEEILFAVYVTDHKKADKVFCFSSNAEMLWEFKAGKIQKFGGKIYSDDYLIQGIGAEDLNRDGKLEIIILAKHLAAFPSQMVLLDCDGTMIGEYWNSGCLTDYCFFDIDSDGRKEIILTGQNDEYQRPCSLILDLNQIEGFSPQYNSQYRCDNYTFSREKYYLLLPVEAVRKLVKDKIAPIRIDCSKEDTDKFLTFKNLITYHFDSGMHLNNIELIRRTYLDHRKYQRGGTITKTPDQLIADLLEEGALYYDGRRWVSEPAMNGFWQTEKRRD
ncbi:MAG: hypothetical protein JW755_01175 [Candidatus Aminicenantes bacterium]|nr:hypothetical protein [Candidatus Aminicenantes bacterium]